MQINNLSFGNIKKTDNTNEQKTSWFNRFLPNDKFVKSEISREKKEEAERAAREFAGQTDLTKQLIHKECHTRYVSAVFQHG